MENEEAAADQMCQQTQNRKEMEKPPHPKITHCRTKPKEEVDKLIALGFEKFQRYRRLQQWISK